MPLQLCIQRLERLRAWAVFFAGQVNTKVYASPPERGNGLGSRLSKRQVLRCIPWMTSIFIATGPSLWMQGFFRTPYPTTTVRLIAEISGGPILGLGIFLAFKRRLLPVARGVVPMLALTVLSGATVGVLPLFWPWQAVTLYGNKSTQLGLHTLPLSVGAFTGTVVAYLLPSFRGHNKILLSAFLVWVLRGDDDD
ncbi:hypothetical protein BDV95DRAFT_605545 [Massariosphaeria phaeospora]|uniref:Uncharacterized protein n=1 Tax=Massariosphaeria phaeospora TaxID=100035 RepID=A0A7C8MAJ8_9PLEO|nr:hypothetical protein BDV95DRAFT_605545 [Massariosphaeria phaeospora]